MEAAAKSIKSLASSLPDRPHHLAIAPDSRYRQHPNDPRLEEEAIRPLQYMTFLFDVDRGLLLTRAYSDLRHEDDDAPRPPKSRPIDPNKPKTKLSLKDYKNRKQDIVASDDISPKKSATPISTPSSAPKPSKAPAPPLKKENGVPTADNMLHRTSLNKAHPSLPPKPELRRPRSPSPDRKKRPSDVADDRSAKRIKVEGATSNSLPRNPARTETPSRSADRAVSHDKKLSKDLKPSPMPNGTARSGLSNSITHGASPLSNSQANGTQKPSSSNHGTPKKKELPALPALLSPLHESFLKSDPRPSPSKKTSDKDNKPQLKRPTQDERETTSTPKKPRVVIPPLLSPTLPPVVREAQASSEDKKTIVAKNAAQNSAVAYDSPGNAKKTVAKPSVQETIRVGDSKERREEPNSMIVKIKYRKGLGKTILRLLALAPKKKSEIARRDTPEAGKRDDHAARERSDSAEATVVITSRKRPRTTTDVSEQPSTTKPPKTAEAVQPSTPSKHPIVMQRVASSSSHTGTPGATNSLTPAGGGAERRSTSVDPEKVNRLRRQHTDLIGIGTKLKHKRDNILKPKDGNTMPNPSSKERNAAMAAIIQSTAAYITGFKAQDDAREAERKQREPGPWKQLVALMRVYRQDCANSTPIFALLMRLHAVLLVWYSRTLVAMGPDDPRAREALYMVMKEQDNTWKLSEDSKRKYENSQSGEDGEKVARLMDRLGPWSNSEDVISVTLKILQKVIRLGDDKFRPEPDLLQALDAMTAGS